MCRIYQNFAELWGDAWKTGHIRPRFQTVPELTFVDVAAKPRFCHTMTDMCDTIYNSTSQARLVVVIKFKVVSSFDN